MNKKATRGKARLDPIVRPAFWIMLSAAQFGPEYAEWFWPRIIDCLIRAGITFCCACMAVKALRSNAHIEGFGDPSAGRRIPSDVLFGFFSISTTRIDSLSYSVKYPFVTWTRSRFSL
jgi:hypothetical protein